MSTPRRAGTIGPAERDHLFRLLHQFNSSDRTVVSRREVCMSVGSTLQGNATALIKDLHYLLEGQTSPDQEEVSVSLIRRHLHNFVAAAMSRVDHMRNLSKGEPEEFRLRYGAIYQELGGSPEHAIVQCLRDFGLHVDLLPVDWLGCSADRGIGLEMYIDTPSLARCGECTRPAARKALAKHPQKLRLLPSSSATPSQPQAPTAG